jgi:hypothetical protein
MTINRYLFGASLLALLQLAGCSKQGANEPAKSDKVSTGTDGKASASAAAISIASLTPDPNQPLTPGTKLTLKISADYVLPSNGGLIGMVIQGADTKPLASTLKDVPGGAGKFTGEVNFVVPNAGNVTVHVPLYIKGESKSVHVAMQQYQIAAK